MSGVWYINASCKIPNDEIAWLAKRCMDDTRFTHRAWSLYHAEIFERLARLIREGYENEASCTHS